MIFWRFLAAWGKRWILVLVACAFLLLGCWSRVELDKQAFVMGAGVDTGEEGFLLTVQLAMPRHLGAPALGAGGSEQRAFWTVTAAGKTIFEADRKLYSLVERRLFWPSNCVLILGEDVAKKGVKPVLDYFTRAGESRRRPWILVCKGITAAEVLQTESELERIPAVAIADLVKQSVENSTTVRTNVNDFLVALAEDGREPVTGRIEIREEPKPEWGVLPREGDRGRTAGGGRKLCVEGGAMFKNDRLVGWLEPDEARGLLWIRDDVKRAGITIEFPTEIGGGTATLKLTRVSSQLVPRVRAGEVVISVEISGDAMTIDIPEFVDVSEPVTLELMDEAVNRAIEGEVKAALDKAQTGLGADIFGFGEAIRRRLPGEWETLGPVWDQVFPHVPVEANARVKVKRVGLTTKSPVTD